MNIIKYSSELKSQWDKFVSISKNGIFMFERNFMDYHADRFIDNSLMFYDEKNELIALLPANLHGSTLISHGGLTFGGFIVNEKMKQSKMLACFDALMSYLQLNSINELIYKTIPHIYHQSPSEDDLYALFKNNARILKTEPSTTIVLSNPSKMPKGRKAQISRAKREGVIIEQSLNFEEFIKLENAVLAEQHNTTAVHTAAELKSLNENFKDNISLWVARFDGEIIAATLLFIYPELVHTQYMASNDKGREIGALDLLLKTLIDSYSITKKYFDFGISTENSGQLLNEGLISQKESFGGRTTVCMTYTILNKC